MCADVPAFASPLSTIAPSPSLPSGLQEAQAWYEDQLRRVTEEWRRSSDEGARGERGRLQRMAEECAELQAAVKEQRRTIDKLTASSCRCVPVAIHAALLFTIGLGSAI